MMLNYQELAAGRVYVLHPATGVVGRVEAYYDGVDRQYVGPNGKPVTAAVLVLDTGDSALVTEDAFVLLTPAEVEVFRFATRLITSALIVTSRFARVSEVSPEVGPLLVKAALMLQRREFDKEDGNGKQSETEH